MPQTCWVCERLVGAKRIIKERTLPEANSKSRGAQTEWPAKLHAPPVPCYSEIIHDDDFSGRSPVIKLQYPIAVTKSEMYPIGQDKAAQGSSPRKNVPRLHPVS